MKQWTLLIVLSLFAFSSCNKDEGLGGSSSVEGYVYKIVHKDDNFSFTSDTVPAVKEDVFIIFGENTDDYFGDDVKTDKEGKYRFDYLRKGKYSVYAYSEYPDQLDKQKMAEVKSIKVGSGTEHVDTIYIHTGKSYGLSLIRGSVSVKYYDKGDLVSESPAVENRVYLKHAGELAPFDDVRVGDQGVFIFQKVPPGKYEIYTVTERIGGKNQPYPTESQIIEVVNPHTVYQLPKTFNIILNI